MSPLKLLSQDKISDFLNLLPGRIYKKQDPFIGSYGWHRECPPPPPPPLPRPPSPVGNLSLQDVLHPQYSRSRSY